jgi:hypothetical protein
MSFFRVKKERPVSPDSGLESEKLAGEICTLELAVEICTILTYTNIYISVHII